MTAQRPWRYTGSDHWSSVASIEIHAVRTSRGPETHDSVGRQRVAMRVPAARVHLVQPGVGKNQTEHDADGPAGALIAQTSR